MDRLGGLRWGLYIGDALAMPVHWYYNTDALARDYGRVTEYLPPRDYHPDSILWRSSYRAENPRGEILHDQARYWGERGVHYHQFLEAGENTLTLQLCRLLEDSLVECGGYDADRFARAYIDFMTTPDRHRDTYLEECHRGFFTNYARGKAPHRCGVEEKHIGGLPAVAPIVAFYADREQAINKSLERLTLTHPGRRMAEAGRLFAELLWEVAHGADLEPLLRDRLARQDSPFLGHPLERWLALPDEQVVGPRLSTACYVEDSLPAVLYLALKYAKDPRGGLIANTNLGGDNTHRGAVLGALLGANNGSEAFPASWREGLRQPNL